MNYFLALFYCLFYGASSFTFSLSVKILYKSYPINLTFLLLLTENIINAVISMIFGKWGHTSKYTLLYSVLYSLQTYTGLKGLQIMNIPMYMTLRRTLILFVFLIQGNGTIAQFITVIFITSGAIIAGAENLEENYFGYSLILTNNILNALTLYIAKQLNTQKSMDPLELVFQNACNQIPFLFIGAYVRHEFHIIEMILTKELCFSILCVGFLGFLLSYSMNLCNMYNSPFAIAITHNVKDIIITTVSILMFEDFYYDEQIIIGIGLSYIGSILYSLQKLKGQKKQEEKDDIKLQ